MPSAYFRMSEERRDAIKLSQREKYKGPAGALHKRRQYLKALSVGLIARPAPHTLEKNGVVWGENGWCFVEDLCSDADS